MQKNNCYNRQCCFRLICYEISKEDFDAKETVEIHKGSAAVDLGADFGVNEDTDSFEAVPALKVTTTSGLAGT